MKGLDAGLVVRRPDGLFYQQIVDTSGGEPDENVSTLWCCIVYHTTDGDSDRTANGALCSIHT